MKKFLLMELKDPEEDRKIRIFKKNYSGKKQRHTVKNLVITNRKKEILYLSNTVQGSMHDFVLMKETLVKNYLLSEMKVYVDTGF
ncbi:MAG: hypothetical protein IPL26_17070 [Leptospiraceae bacterium]|nr:hypothetical protein [Leptospiraceae bacterium]